MAAHIEYQSVFIACMMNQYILQMVIKICPHERKKQYQ